MLNKDTMLNYSIATFCFGERYYLQTNRLIESLSQLDEIPELFIITDSPKYITEKKFVNVKHINEYNSKYSNYNNNYYDFDFSVKRFSLQFALESGYNKIILTDTDVVVNEHIFNTKNVLNSFIENSISGQVTYQYEKEKETNSMLGKRFDYYESKFNKKFDKKNLWMPEDCVQYINISHDKFKQFLMIWDECIKIKDSDGLLNVPAGNIDEMCFSALYNEIELKNNSNKSINLLIPIHDKWY